MNRPASLIVDGSNLLCRAAFALPDLTLNDDDGTPCGGTWGLVKQVCAALESTGADELHLCWDGGRSPRRLHVLPTYKAHRDGDLKHQEKMERIWAQAPDVNRILTAAGAWTYKAPGVEGDDVIALLATSVANRDRDAIIVSNDNDFLQLVGTGKDGAISLLTGAGSGQHRHWLKGRSATALIGESALATKALIGCKSDGIPGIAAGLGETRAAALREAVLADGASWDCFRLRQIIHGWEVPGYGMADHKNVTKAVDLLTAGDRQVTEALTYRNELLCDLQAAMQWPEVVECALNPDYCYLGLEGFGSYEDCLEEVLAGLGWKPEPFRALSALWGD